MTDTILLRHIIEGLIHNLNNPLNMVLGYSQRIKTEHPEIVAADKIYKAGIRIDDTLKQMASQLWKNSFNIPQELLLNSWLDEELAYLQHYLPLKHRFVLQRDDLEQDVQITYSPMLLAVWYEGVFAKLCELLPEGFRDITTGICMYKSLPAIYLKLEGFTPATDSFSELLRETNTTGQGSAGIETIWQESAIYGVCK